MKIGVPCIVMLGLIGLQSCASRSVMLVHPQSGSTVRCEEQGVGLLAAAVGAQVQECLENYHAKGFVRTEDLMPEQRADLERRGILPKAEKPPARMGY
jgi:ribosomal protein S12 methylthiotransferase accessory factor YcaO